MQAGNVTEASRVAAGALDVGHVHPALFTLRALSHRADGRLDAAQADLTRALELDPRSVWALSELAECLITCGRHRDALNVTDRALAHDRKYSRVWFQKGVAHQGLLELAPARAAYLEALKLEPSLSEASARLASMAADQGCYGDARRFAGAALAEPRTSPLAVIALIDADLAEGRLEEGERHLTALLARVDVAPGLRAVAVAQLGDLRDRQNRTAEAFEAYSRSRSIWADHNMPQWRNGEFGTEQALRLAAALAPVESSGQHA